MISIVQATLLLWSKGIETDIHYLSDCPDIDVARNTLQAMFMEEADATDHFWIDYDLGFPADAVLAILERPEDIVAGAYRVKMDEPEQYSVVPKLKDGFPIGKVIGNNQALIEADFLATGFMRVKRGVYEKMAEAYPELKYEENVIKTVNHQIKEAYDFFNKTISKSRKRFTTEDYSFCQRWRDIGGQLWIYPDIEFDHIGKKAYHGNLHEFYMRQPGGAKEKLQKAERVPGWMQSAELAWLGEQAREHTNIVEIGSWMGRSTRIMADNTSGTVIAVDTWEGTPAEHSEIMKALTPENLFKAFQLHTADCHNIVPFKGTSVHAASYIMAPDFDMIFIDAAHDYDNVKADIEAWLPRLAEGGLLCGHDFTYSKGVEQAVREFLPGFSLIPHTDIWAWQKPKTGLPSAEDLDVAVKENLCEVN